MKTLHVLCGSKENAYFIAPNVIFLTFLLAPYPLKNPNKPTLVFERTLPALLT